MYSTKKKFILILCGVLLVAVAAGWLFYADSLRYGDSYSEQQRRLWNERRQLSPALWSMWTLELNSTRYLNMIAPKDDASWTGIRDQKKAKDEGLKKEQVALRDREKPVFQCTPSQELDLASLRAFELSRRECWQRAQGGDADACMVMAWRSITNNSENLLSWRSMRDLDAWLSRAEALKRPGALFLKNFCRMIQVESSKLIEKDSLTGYGYSNVACPDYTGLPGYGEFEESMRQGDILPYFLVRDIVFCHRLPDRDIDLLREGLRRKVKTGDVQAMEDLAALALDQINIHWEEDISWELDHSTWSRFLERNIPGKWQEDGRNILVRMGVLDVADTSTVQNYREGVENARRAARLGSLAGMSYWLSYGLWNRNFYSREDWEDVFRYYRTLIEKGYMPYLTISRVMQGPKLDREILECCYGSDAVGKSLLGKQDAFIRGEEIWFQDFLEDVKKNGDAKKKLAEWCSWRGSDVVLRQILLQLIQNDASFIPADVSAVCADKVQALADEGDPFGLYVLGCILEEGIWRTRDLGKAWDCYVEATRRSSNKDLTNLFYRDFCVNGHLSMARLPEAAKMALISMAIRHPEFPGRNPSFVFDVTEDLSTLVKWDKLGVLLYLIGRVYEDGIGIQPDKKKAMDCYSQGRTYAPCSERWEKLQAEFAPPDQKEE